MVLPRYLMQRSLRTRAWSVQRVLQSKPIGDSISLHGWIKRRRRMGKQILFLDVVDGSTFERLQVVYQAPPGSEVPHVLIGTPVSIDGTLQKSTHPKQEMELLAERLVPRGLYETKEAPLMEKNKLTPAHYRQYLHLRPRAWHVFASLLRVRSALSLAVHDHFRSQGFHLIHAPVLTSNDSEGAGNTFSVQCDSLEVPSTSEEATTGRGFFEGKTHLTVSSQLHLEAAACGLSNVYCLGPAFRAERGRSLRHMCEFWMLEAEMSFVDDLEVLIAEVQGTVRALWDRIRNSADEELDFQWKSNGVDEKDNSFPFLEWRQAFRDISSVEEDTAGAAPRPSGFGVLHVASGDSELEQHPGPVVSECSTSLRVTQSWSSTPAQWFRSAPPKQVQRSHFPLRVV
ncbi:unnamed protein product [Cyprideis torosa]|uniref:Aminoacyl-transfer RNA synthetases class-II family profile domain-containing protein n=1 Tax=Cyprideis torosa TaxID=163714 RepID=A0A7R8WJ68_9CRUS|nr:unnamed protein product [Cyprideis torosa]CAG0895415.1 unnamed protein product [Cyprideis torosa]